MNRLPSPFALAGDLHKQASPDVKAPLLAALKGLGRGSTAAGSDIATLIGKTIRVPAAQTRSLKGADGLAETLGYGATMGAAGGLGGTALSKLIRSLFGEGGAEKSASAATDLDREAGLDAATYLSMLAGGAAGGVASAPIYMALGKLGDILGGKSYSGRTRLGRGIAGTGSIATKVLQLLAPIGGVGAGGGVGGYLGAGMPDLTEKSARDASLLYKQAGPDLKSILSGAREVGRGAKAGGSDLFRMIYRLVRGKRPTAGPLEGARLASTPELVGYGAGIGGLGGLAGEGVSKAIRKLTTGDWTAQPDSGDVAKGD